MLHKAMSRATCATNVRDKLLGKLPCVLTATLSSMDICRTRHFHKYAICQKGHSLSKRLPLRPTILDRWAEDNVKTLTVFSTFKYCEQQTPLPLQAMLVQHRSHPRLFSEQHCFKGKGIRIFFENKTKQNKTNIWNICL